MIAYDRTDTDRRNLSERSLRSRMFSKLYREYCLPQIDLLVFNLIVKLDSYFDTIDIISSTLDA